MFLSYKKKKKKKKKKSFLLLQLINKSNPFNILVIQYVNFYIYDFTYVSILLICTGTYVIF